MDSDQNCYTAFCKACWSVFLPTLFFCFVLLLVFFIIFLIIGLKLETWADVLILTNIGILFSSSCVIAFGKWVWVSQKYRLPNLLGFLSDQAVLKTHVHFPHKNKLYLEKVRSMNTVVSILMLIVTVVMLLNHELKIRDEDELERKKLRKF